MQHTRSLTSLLIVFGLAIGLSSSPAPATFIPRVEIELGKDGTACILVNARRVIHLKTSNGDLSPADRANIAVGRLKNFVGKGLDPKTISFKKAGQAVSVMAGESLLVIATAVEARKHGLSPEKLAENWVKELQNALCAPPLAANPSSLVIPLGENRTVTVESLLPEPVEFAVSDASVVTADAQTKPGALVIMGISTGDAVIDLRCGEYQATIQIAVRKYAARTAPAANAVVTGWKAPAALVSRAAHSAILRAISLEPGARITSTNLAAAARDLSSGQTLQAPVQIQAEGNNLIPAKLTVQVLVENQPLPAVPTAWLMYSNDPERVLRYQTLFTGRIDPSGESIRLLYHHQNMMRTRVGFVVDVVNPSASWASVHVIEGVSGPMVDTVLVGYKAGLEFLGNRQNRVGQVIQLPPGTRSAIVSQPVDYTYTASGILELQQLSGEPLLVRVIAKPEDRRIADDVPEAPIQAPEIDQSKTPLSQEVYPSPLKKLEVKYTIGKTWTFLRIGKHPIKHATEERQLYGNYGVIYEIEATLENPLHKPHTVELAFEATAGTASGIFNVDGKTIRVKSLRAPREATLTKITIPAGKSRTISIRTMPLSGSAYPVTLIIRPAGPLT